MKDDEIKSLPGWSGALPTKHYSGLVQVGTTQGRAQPAYMHYYLQLSEGDPATDPVVSMRCAHGRLRSFAICLSPTNFTILYRRQTSHSSRLLHSCTLFPRPYG